MVLGAGGGRRTGMVGEVEGKTFPRDFFACVAWK